uniref:Uncharacterized protein n=1 Tax=Tetranychus urticae TaxID=32264 RepID=T1JUD7_TETUR
MDFSHYNLLSITHWPDEKRPGD